ncbi:MAG TPA: TnsA endonuclease N-terminal domain-containing protein [Pyrinomonadaceae bacterium]|nr:TnsA endonuclease N-terminal domain-containing protein [Pyrinomonadaceae bacterium]
MLARKISNTGTRNLVGKFPSLKMGRIVWYESLLERDYMYLLEIDSDVISYREQPGRIYYTLDGRRRHYTPDLLVERGREKQLVEVKPKKKAEEEEYRRLFRIAGETCRRDGYEFRVATDEMIRLQPRLNGAKLLYKYAKTPLLPQHQIVCHEFFTVQREVPLGEVTRFFASRGIGRQVVYALIFRGVLSVDLMCPLTQDAVVRLPIPAYPERKAS